MIKPGGLSLYQKLIAELDDEIARLMHTLWLTDDFSRDFPSWLEVWAGRELSGMVYLRFTDFYFGLAKTLVLFCSSAASKLVGGPA